MSDANPPEGLPPAAHVVGGVRHATPTRPVHVEPSNHEAKQTTAGAIGEGGEQSTEVATTSKSDISVRDAAEQPKAVASTYFPPTNTHHGPNDHAHKGHINTKGQQKQIQQMGGSHGYK